MTVLEFKKKYPHLAHLEGDALWNAMEDSLWQNANWDPDEPITLSEEDEIQYQKDKILNNKGVLINGVNWQMSKYTRKFWLAFDKRIPFDKPTSTYQFIIFDISPKDSLDKS